MAKRKTKLVNVAEAPAMPDMKPRMYIDLRDEDVDMLGEVKVGETAYIMIKGKVVGINKRESAGPEGKHKNGDIQLEDTEVEFATKGAFEALAEDD